MPIFLTAIGAGDAVYERHGKSPRERRTGAGEVTEGQEVRQGQTIMVMDPRAYQAALDQAKGTLAHDEALFKDAQADSRRYQRCLRRDHQRRLWTRTKPARAGIKGRSRPTRRPLRRRSCKLDWCQIHSPINGRIGLRLVDPGNIITANTTNLVIINQFQPIAVYFTLPENLLPEVLQVHSDERAVRSMRTIATI